MKPILITLNEKHSRTERSNYLRKAKSIVDLYNEYGGFPESLNLQKPESTRILTIEGDKGGLLLDRMNGKDEVFYRLMFAAFEEHNRGKGALRACLDLAERKGIDIRFVELNPFDNDEVWKRVGFEHSGTWGFSLVASRVKEDFICYGEDG